MILSVGAKVFIIGEYLALSGGPALLASVEPRFRMRIEAGQGKSANIAAQSPAGIFYARHSDFFAAYDVEFIDPLNGAGGWGASSAQYAMLAAFYYGQDAIRSTAQMDLDLHTIDKTYLQITRENTVGLPPSGMDVIAQLQGGMVWIDRNAGRIANVVWPFADLTFLLVATGVKVPTHLHLNSVFEVPEADLAREVNKFAKSFADGDSVALVEALQGFRQVLQANQLEAVSTTAWLEKILPIEGVQAVKGCGALGADVLLLLINKKNEDSIIAELQKLGLRGICSKEALTGPLQVDYPIKIHEPKRDCHGC